MPDKEVLDSERKRRRDNGVRSVKATGRRGKGECEGEGWMDGEGKRDRCL